MISSIALEELIKENEEKEKFHKDHLAKHESGEAKLSAMSKASSENALEIASENLLKYKEMLTQMQSEEGKELEKKILLEKAAKRKKYFDSQDSRIKANIEEPSDVKLAALRIIAELSIKTQYEDEKLFDLARKSIELSLPELSELLDTLENIKKDFSASLKQSDEESIEEFASIDSYIPIIILHFNVLFENINQSVEDHNEKAKANNEEGINESIEYINFSGFPKYEDWWVRELWLSHQAYFALFKWKSIISSQCFTLEQKKAWSIIFDNWIFVKKILNDKGSLAFDYHYAFDSALNKYAQIDEELVEKNIISMEHIISEITSKEDFSKNISFHNVKTPYLKYKLKKLKKSKV